MGLTPTCRVLTMMPVTRWLRRTLDRLLRFTDDALPVPPDQRAEREWTPESGDSQSRRRKLRLKLHMLEKRGKGGYR